MAELVCHKCYTKLLNPECPKCGPMAMRIKELEVVAEAALEARARLLEWYDCNSGDVSVVAYEMDSALRAAGKLEEEKP